MILQYETCSENIFDKATNCIILLENWLSPSRYLLEIINSPDRYILGDPIKEYLQVYKRNNGCDIIGINIGPINDLSEYQYKITLAVASATEIYGNRFSIFLTETNNFLQFAQAMTGYCEINQKKDLILSIYCNQEVFNILESEFSMLEKKLKNQEKSIALHLLSALQCYKCKQFSYNPSSTTCCKITLCHLCISQKCDKCNKPLVKEKIENFFEGILKTAPYYCKCGLKYRYCDRNDHLKICKFPNYLCKICGCLFSYSEIIAHIDCNHQDFIINSNIF